MTDGKLKTLLLLHLLLLFYSFSGIFSKLASGTQFLSLQFCLFYLCMLGVLGIYAIGWQQVLKRMALTTAFSNKAIIIVWGIIWGAVFFAEPITLLKVLGAALITVGVVLFSKADSGEVSEEIAAEGEGLLSQEAVTGAGATRGACVDGGSRYESRDAACQATPKDSAHEGTVTRPCSSHRKEGADE